MFNKRKVVVIDIQDSYNHRLDPYPGSINIPYDDLMNNYRNYLNKSDVYYVYCKSGKISKRVVTVLSYLGYNINVIER